jgi:hypothetical protein
MARINTNGSLFGDCITTIVVFDDRLELKNGMEDVCMTRSFRMLCGLAATLGVASLAFSGSVAHAQTAYALAGGGTSLFSFNVAATGTIATTIIGSFGGVTLSAIDFRPTTGVLYGYSDTTDTVYTISTTTGALTTVVTATGAQVTSSGQLGIDFNPTTGGGNAIQFRTVTSADENRVVNVTMVRSHLWARTTRLRSIR